MNDRFDDLIAATDGVEPRRDFADRVMAEVDRSDPNDRIFWLELPRVARRVVPVAVLAAAAAAVWAFRATRAADDAALGGAPTDQIVVGTLDPSDDVEQP